MGQHRAHFPKALTVTGALGSFLMFEGIEPTNNSAKLAKRPEVIQRKLNDAIQSANGAMCRARLLTITTTLRQQGRDAGSSWCRPGSLITTVG